MMRILFGILAIFCIVLSAHAQDSLNMRCLSKLDYWQDPDDIQMVGNLAYVVCNASGLHIIDLSDAANPVEIGRYLWNPGSYSCGGIDVVGNLAYLATGIGLLVLDISDPAHPVALNEPFECCMVDILIHDNMGIGIDGNEGYPFLVDVSNPDSIFFVQDVPSNFIGPTQLIGMVGDYFCVRNYRASTAYISLYGFDALHHLQPVSELPVQQYLWSGMIAGNYAYLASNQDGVRIFDVSNPLEPVSVGFCNCGGCTDVAVEGNHAVIAKGDSSLEVWNIADPTNTFFEGSCSVGYNLRRVVISESIACVGCSYGEKAVMAVDVSNPTAPSLMSSFGSTGYLTRMTIDGTMGYVADQFIGLHSLDLSDPTHAIEVGRSDRQYTGAHDIAVHDDLAYLATQSGLRVYDVRNPDQPQPFLNTGYSISYNPQVAINGDYVYTCRNQDGIVCGYILTYDFHDLSLPVCVDSIWMSGLMDKFIIADNYLYCVGRDVGLNIFSLADPASPQLVKTYAVPWSMRDFDLAVEGAYAYLTVENEGIRVINISYPATPTDVTVIQRDANRIAVSGDILAIAKSDQIEVLDISNLMNPVTVGFYAIDDCITDIKIYNSHILTTSSAKFGVYQSDALAAVPARTETSPLKYALHSCYPNPFNPTTQIDFDMRQSGHVSVNVYNLLGQRVAELVNGNIAQGQHSVMFDAQNLPSGLYIYRMEANGFSEQQKMTLVK